VSTKVVDTDRSKVATRVRRQDRAVDRTLELADAAAARGDYVDALARLSTLDAIGYQLDPVYEKRRAAWRSRVETRQVGCSQWFG